MHSAVDKLMSATEIISEGPEGIILESVLEGYAEYYSADLSEKVIRGMTENALKGKFTGDAHFLRQVQQIQLGGPWLLPVPPHFADWVQPDAFLSREKGVVFLSGPQLAGKAGQRAREMVAHGALGIMTGTPDAGSLSAEMLEKGQMLFLRYPVHLDAMQCRELVEKNQFDRVIPYHSPEIDCPCSFLL